ncbi:MAG: NifB/NifX family molybdenum-iron cluster-binding protein [Thermodesulfobacteriota bacterium]
MKVAVSSTGKDLHSPVDPRFGRAPYLLIVDTGTLAIVEVIDNSQADAMAHGAGIAAATRIAEAGAGAVLSGIIGPKAAAVCQKAGITMINGASGTVQEAVEAFVDAYEVADAPQTGRPLPPRISGQRPGGERLAGAGRGRCGGGRGMGGGMGMGGGRRRGQCRNV